MLLRIGSIAVLLLAACGSGSPPGAEDVSDVTPAPSTSTAPSTTSPRGTTSAPSTTSARVGTPAPEAGCAHVVDVAVVADDSTFRFDVTVRSTETGWDKYADAWEVRAGDVVLGQRVLLHPHETEQPFTRSLTGVEVPEGVREVTVAARDSVLGFCGEQLTVNLPGRA